MTNDDRVDDAIRALRASTSGASDRAGQARHRVLVEVRRRAERRSQWMSAAAVVVVAFAASTAWAAAYARAHGGLAWPAANRERVRTGIAPRASLARARALLASNEPQAPLRAVRSVTVDPTPPPTRDTLVPRATSNPAARPRVRPIVSRDTAPSAPVELPSDADAIFREGHIAHFRQHDARTALAAWDRYLQQAPDGRYAPEARYNRAIDLLRLGRTGEAIDALRPFANASVGAYRQRDAQALIERLSRPGASR